MLFGTNAIPTPPLSASEAARVRGVLEARRLRGKKLLLCSGGADELVPYAASAPLIAVLQDAVADGRAGVTLEDRVYDGVGHRFSKDMVEDAVRFLVKVVGEGPRERRDEEKARI
jgi:predicted esterase